jgi:hypothetical protein
MPRKGITGSILAKYPVRAASSIPPSSKSVDLQLKVTDFVDFVK